jgi:hypothetical protein
MTSRREGFGPAGSLTVEDRPATVPDWLLDADISDCAVRLYAVLVRHGQSPDPRMPSRAMLAWRVHQRSTDSVDRAMEELVRIGAVQVQPGYDEHHHPTSVFHVRSTKPGPADAKDKPIQPEVSAAEELRMARALLEVGWLRVELQIKGRQQLQAEGSPITRAAVTQRAYQLLQETRAVDGP